MKKIKSLLPIGLLMIFTFAGCIVNEPLIEDFPSDKVSFKYEVVADCNCRKNITDQDTFSCCTFAFYS